VEEVDEGTWKQLIQYNPQKLPIKRNRSEKRSREQDADEDAVTNDAVRVRKFGKLEGEEKRGREERKRADDSGEEDVYEHVELGPYGMDGGANLDFREHDEAYENLGDYETMRGQIGDEDGTYLFFSLYLLSLPISFCFHFLTFKQILSKSSKKMKSMNLIEILLYSITGTYFLSFALCND
jgi:hypothetical protein